MGDDAPSRKLYRQLPTSKRRPAPGEVGTMRQQLSAISAYLEIQDADYQTGWQADRRWQVIQCLHAGSPIPITYGEGRR